MPCSTQSLYPLLVMPDLDLTEVRLGQLLVLASALSLVVAARVLALLLAGF